jgi:hypothetical protein
VEVILPSVSPELLSAPGCRHGGDGAGLVVTEALGVRLPARSSRRHKRLARSFAGLVGLTPLAHRKGGYREPMSR